MTTPSQDAMRARFIQWHGETHYPVKSWDEDILIPMLAERWQIWQASAAHATKVEQERCAHLAETWDSEPLAGQTIAQLIRDVV